MSNRLRPIGAAQRRRILIRDGYTCVYCFGEATEVDHVIPYSYIPDNTDANLVASCGECNRLAYNMVFLSFIQKYLYIKQRRHQRGTVGNPNWRPVFIIDEAPGQIYKRDNYQCQSCRVRFTVHYLSCHHIVPRSEGGDNNPRNLVTLCKPCHDLVERDEVKTLHDILYYRKRLDVLTEKEIADEEIIEEITNSRPDDIDWRLWVYGGGRRRQKGY